MTTTIGSGPSRWRIAARAASPCCARIEARIVDGDSSPPVLASSAGPISTVATFMWAGNRLTTPFVVTVRASWTRASRSAAYPMVSPRMVIEARAPSPRGLRIREASCNAAAFATKKRFKLKVPAAMVGTSRYAGG